MTRRVLVVTDSDSYVKYGSALAARMPADWERRMVIVGGNALPSERQIAEGLYGSGLRPDDVDVVDRAALRTLLRQWRPDVVVAAARGMTAEPVVSMVAGLEHRPVLVTGLPGVSIPPLAPGLRLRQGADVFIVHSRREQRESRALAAEGGLEHRFELGSLPFLHQTPVDGPKDRILFAGQAVIPPAEDDRRWLLGKLIETAEKHPHLKVVIKLRARHGEAQTHVERFSYEDLLAERVAAGEIVPDNLVVDVGPMTTHLERAVGCVTVSSTAVLEAVAMDVPSLVLDDFGVGASQINQVFEGSGLIGSADDLVAGRFASPGAAWRDDNYLHPTGDETWIGAIEELLAQRDAGTLGPVRRRARLIPSRMIRRAVYERLAFGASPRAVLNRLYVRSSFWHGHHRWRTRK